MRVKGIRPIMNSRGDMESPWKIPLFIAKLTKFWLFEVGSTFQRGMAYCKKILDIISYFKHGKTLHDQRMWYHIGSLTIVYPTHS